MALEFLRRHHQRKSLFLTIPLIIIVLSFVALYFPSLQGAATGSRSQEVGRVGSLPITLGEFQSAYSNRRRFYEQAYRGQVDERMLRAMGLENQVFEGLVSQKLLELEAQRLGIVVDDAAVAKAIAEDPNLQRDGKFVGREELLRLLALQGVAPDDFTEQQRQRLVIERLRAIVAAGASVSPAEAEDEYRRRNEQLKAEYVQVSAQPFRAAASVSDDEVRQRFAAKQDHYAIPEKRVVAALLIDPSALRAGITVPDTETNRYYEEHRSEFIEPEQACASHILVRVKSGDGDAEGHADADARKIADDLLAKAKAGGDFAALAKKSSEDKGSATNGGDLGCFPAGRMLPEFDSAAFGLASGQLSDVVKTSYGYHIIRMNERKAESVPAMSAVKEQIAARLVGERAAALADEKQQTVQETLAKGRTLEEASRAAGLTVTKSAPFARGDTPAPPLASKELAVAAFALKPGATDKQAFNVGAATAFIALSEVQPARPAQLEEVTAQVRADLVEEQAFAAAEARARELRGKAAAGPLDKAAASLGLVRKETLELVARSQPLGDLGSGAGLERAVFALPAGTLSDPIRTSAGYALVRVTEKKAFDPAAFAKEQAALVAQLTEEKRANLFDAFLRAARDRYVVEQRPELVRRSVG